MSAYDGVEFLIPFIIEMNGAIVPNVLDKFAGRLQVAKAVKVIAIRIASVIAHPMCTRTHLTIQIYDTAFIFSGLLG